MCYSEVGLFSCRSQCNLTEPYTPRDALINEAQHISNLLFTVWMKFSAKYIEYGEKDDVSVVRYFKDIPKSLIYNDKMELESRSTFVSSSSNAESKHWQQTLDNIRPDDSLINCYQKSTAS